MEHVPFHMQLNDTYTTSIPYDASQGVGDDEVMHGCVEGGQERQANLTAISGQ